MKPAHRPLPAGDADPSGWKARTAARALREVDDVAGADKYVRAMVVFALVLFRVVMGERFKVCGVPIAANTVADGLLADDLCAISTLARLHPGATIGPPSLSDSPQPGTGIRRKNRVLAVDPCAQRFRYPYVGLGQRQGWEVAGVRRSSVGALERPGRSLRPSQRLVNRQSVGDQSGEHLADHLAVGAYHRVRQLGILERRQDPGRVDVQLTKW